MFPPRRPRPLGPPIRLGLGLGGALLVGATALAQISPSMSSGSGPGTGTGGSPSFRGNVPGGSPFRPRPDLGPLPTQEPAGILETLADPTAGMPMQGLKISDADASRMIEDLEKLARGLSEPSPRAGTLERAAKTRLQALGDTRTEGVMAGLDDARDLLVDAWRAVREIREQLAHDNRSASLADTLGLLAAAYQSQALVASDLLLPEDEKRPQRTLAERLAALDRSLHAYAMAASVAAEVFDPNIRGEALFKVAESEARAAGELVGPRFGDADDETGAGTHQRPRREAMADRLIVAAAEHARLIRRTLWRDRALFAVSAQATDSGRFEQSLAIARSIPQPQSRADALVRLAEAQCRKHGMAREATKTYSEAAHAVACITKDDPRAILADVLINSLVLTGRFRDARASVPLIKDTVHQYEALGMIAEEMGRRGHDQEARAWIADEIVPEGQQRLLRRVGLGMVAALEQHRTEVHGRGAGFDGPLDLPPPGERSLPPPIPNRR